MLVPLLVPWLVAAQPSLAKERTLPPTTFVWGARASIPLIASASAGVYVRSQGRGGFLFEAEPGINGGEIAFGWAHLAPAPKPSPLPPLQGEAVKIALLQTWGPEIATPAGRTYLGGELHVTYGLRLALGGFAKIGGDPPGGSFLVSFGLGFGL